MLWRKAVFIILVIFCLSPFGTPQLSIVLGAALGLTLGNPFRQINNKTTELLLEASIVLLAFGTDLASVYRSFKDGAIFVSVAVFVFVTLVFVFGRVLRANNTPVVFAGAENILSDDEDYTQYPKPLTAAIIVSAVGLIVFPLIGRYFHFNADQFGIWAAMAIPGPAFVAGSAATLKPDATTTAIPLALTAMLLIGVLALISHQLGARDSKLPSRQRFPWFALIFLLAVAVRTYAPVSIFPSIFDSVVNLGNAGIVVGLFFVGAGISRSDIKNSGPKQFIQVVLPWLLVSAVSLWAVLHLL